MQQSQAGRGDGGLSPSTYYTEKTKRRITVNGVRDQVPGLLVQVRVNSTVRNLDHGTTTDTGQFTYSYFVAAKPGQEEPILLPQSYSEMMDYVEGRRNSLETAAFFEERQLSRVQGVVSE